MLRDLLFFLLLLTLTSPAMAAAPSPASDALKRGPDEGVVLLHLVRNFPVASNVGYHTSPVELQRADGVDDKKFILSVDTLGSVSSAHLLGAVPAGRYRIRDFSPQIGCWICGEPTLPPHASMPEVVVRAGEVSYLGPVLLSVTSDIYGMDRTVRWGWNETPDLDYGRRTFAALQPAHAAMPVGNGWGETVEAGLAGRLRDAIRSNSGGMVLGGPHRGDGFYFGAQNGVVKRWRPGSQIEMLDTSSDFFLLSTLETRGGVLMAAGEMGVLRSSSDDGRTWSDRSDGLPFGVVSNLTLIDDADGVVFTVVANGRVGVYRGDARAEGFERIADFELKFAWTGIPGVLPQMFRHESRLVLTLPSHKFALIDLETGRSEVLDPPGSIRNFKMGPDGTLWCTCVKTIAFTPFVSRDYGRTWERSEISRHMVLPEFYNAERGFSYQSAMSAKKAGVSTTTDGGKTWTLTHEPDINRAWWTPAYSADGSVMLLHSVQVFGNLGITLSKYSLDGGANWISVPRAMAWAKTPQAQVEAQ